MRSLFDVGMGDFRWMRPWLTLLAPDVRYRGVDLVPELVKTLQETWGRKARGRGPSAGFGSWGFKVVDLVGCAELSGSPVKEPASHNRSLSSGKGACLPYRSLIYNIGA